MNFGYGKRIGTAGVVAVAVLACAVFCGCKKKEPPAQAPVKVDVRPAKVETVEEYIEYPVSTTGVATVDIRARVDGYLQTIDFKSGDIVKANQRLFLIDPRSYQAQVDMAKAELIKAQADLNLSETKLAGIEEMYKQGAAGSLNVIRPSHREMSPRRRLQWQRRIWKKPTSTSDTRTFWLRLPERSAITWSMPET